MNNLDLKFEDLESWIGDYLGFGRGVLNGETAWNARSQKTIDDSLKVGLRLFYYPNILPGESGQYQWSFLRPVRQVSLAVGTHEVNLPTDFGGLEGPVLILGTNRVMINVAVVGDQDVEQKLAMYPSETGQPRVCYVRWNQATTKERGPRASLKVFPPADTAYTLQVLYYIQPEALSSPFPFAQGGAVHAETIKAACLAAAELDRDGVEGPKYAYFMERLKVSIANDRRSKAQTLGYNSDPSIEGINWPNSLRDFRAPGITYNGVLPDG